MTFDFRADQVRTARIISSGSLPLLIYPSASAADLEGGLAGFSTGSVGTDVFFYVSGSGTKRSVFGGDVRVSGSLTASIKTVDGTNNYIVGDGITVNYNNSTKQFELTGSSIAVGGSDGSIQFNNNGLLSGAADFSFISGTLGVATISGNNPSTPLSELGVGSGLLFDSNIALSNSLALMSGIDPDFQIGGILLTNGAAINVFSGSVSNNPGASIEPGIDADTAQMSVRGNVSIITGSFDMSDLVATPSFSVRSGSYSDPTIGLYIQKASPAGHLKMALSGALTASMVYAPELTGSLKTTNGATNFIVAKTGIANYNSIGQWELTGAFKTVCIANYSRTNLTNATLIGYAYFNPSEYSWASSLKLEAIGMNMDGVSGSLGLYSQNDAAYVTTLSWNGVSTLTTGSYQSASVSIPATAKSYELHFSQSGGSSGGSSYTSVGFVNFRIE